MNLDSNYLVNMEEIETQMITDRKSLLFAEFYLLNDWVI